MNPEELEFILKMRDEASALLDKIGDSLKKTGDGAKKFGDENEKAGGKLDNLVKKAKEATVALGGLYASMRTLQGTVGAWGQYELGLVGVVKTTNMAGRELDDFRKKFDNLNRGMNGIDTGQLQQLSETVGQLGVKGVDNIVSMTEVLGKLGVTTDIVGAQGASAVSRILTLTGEGAKAVGEFGDALNYLGNNTAATESEILDMATVLAQSTAEFGMSSKNILALSAGARQLGVNFELFGTSSGRVLRSLRDGLANNTTGFKSFLQVTNMTREQFATLLEEKPEEVLLKFAEAYNSLTASGGSKGLLQALGMDTDEIKRVFGAIGTQVEAVRDKLRLVQSPDMEGALDREAQQFFDAQNNQIQGMMKAFTSLKASIGEALSPLTGPLITAATGTLNALTDIIQGLPVGIKQVAAAFIVLTPAIGGVVAASKLLAPLFTAMGFSGAVSGVGLLTKAMGGLRAALALAGTALSRTWPLIIGMLAAEGVRRSEDWITSWVQRNFSEENIQRMRNFRKEYEGFFDFMAQDPLSGTIQSGPNAGMNYWTGKRDYIQNDKGEWEKYTPEPPKDWGDGIGQTLRDKIQQGIKKAGSVTIPISDDDYEALKSLNSRIGLMDDLAKREQALQNIRERSLETLQSRNDKITQQEIDRAQRVLDLQKEQLSDPIGFSLRDVDDEIDAARAVTGENKNQLAIHQRIRDLIEQTGLSQEEVAGRVTGKMKELFAAQSKVRFDDTIRGLEDDINAARAVTAEAKAEEEVRRTIRDLQDESRKLDEDQKNQIRAKVQELQKARQAAAFEDQLRSARESLAIAQATTDAERDRLKIAQDIANFERSNGQLLSDQRNQLASIMAATQQATALRSLLDDLDPVGTATRQYAADQAVLNKALQDGSITLAQYQHLMASLDRLSLSARDPFADQLKSIRESIQLAQISGDYKKADVKTQQAVNQLADRNIILTKEQIAQLQEYNRQLQDIESASSSGFVGWADSVGTLRDNLLGAAKDFASSMSDAISGALVGEKGGFQNMLRNLGKQLVSIGVNQIMKSAVRDMQNAVGKGGFLGGLAEKLGISKSADVSQPDFLKNLSTAQMSVTAANVVLSGAGLGVAGGTGSEITRALPAANSNKASDAFSKILNDNLSTFSTSPISTGNSLQFAKNFNANIDKKLLAILQDAASKTNLNVEAISGLRPGDKRFHGKGMAADVRLSDPLTGRVFDNYQNAGDFRVYEQFAQQARLSQMEMFPELQDQFRWGGYFSGGKGKYGALDSMHFDVGGGRVGMGGGSWENGLNSQMRALWPGVQSVGMGGAANGIDVAAVTNSIQQVNTNLNQMGTNIGQVANNAQMAASNFTSTGMNLQQAGMAAQQAGPQFDQAGTKIQQAGMKANSSAPQVMNFGQATGGLQQPLADATSGLGGFGQGLMGLIQQLMGGLGGGGGGFGGIFSSIFSLFLHEGGKVGPTSPTINLSSYAGIPKFHTGSSKQGDEYLALLQKGERVLTESQDNRTQRALAGLTSGMGGGGRGGGGGGVFAPSTVINVEGGGGTPEDREDMASKISDQIDTLMDLKMQEFVAKQSLAGGMFNRSRFT